MNLKKKIKKMFTITRPPYFQDTAAWKIIMAENGRLINELRIVQCKLLQDKKKLTEALNECYSTIAALEKGNEGLREENDMLKTEAVGEERQKMVDEDFAKTDGLRDEKNFKKIKCSLCGGTGRPCAGCGEYHPSICICPPHEVRMKWAKDICPDCGATESLNEDHSEAVCMKAFKKWKLKNDKGLMDIANDLDRADTCTVGAEIGWRGALKEVLRQLKFGNSVAYARDDVLMAIKSFIKKELEG